MWRPLEGSQVTINGKKRIVINASAGSKNFIIRAVNIAGDKFFTLTIPLTKIKELSTIVKVQVPLISDAKLRQVCRTQFKSTPSYRGYRGESAIDAYIRDIKELHAQHNHLPILT